MQIEAALVQRLIAGQFPQWADLPIAQVLPGGWDNRTFRLGDELSVRLPSAERYTRQIPVEYRWLPQLAPHLSVAIPTPVALGRATPDYPWPWSINRWIEGEAASPERIGDMDQLAHDLAVFVKQLQAIDPVDGPAPGARNFYRGGSLEVYDQETRSALNRLTDQIDADAALALWDAALATAWPGPPVWLHGDLHASNLLIENGQLRAVIDFGGMAVGDPACDLTVTWTLFTGSSRCTFRKTVGLDQGTWQRGRAWALWKASILAVEHLGSDEAKAENALRVIADLIDESIAPETNHQNQ